MCVQIYKPLFVFVTFYNKDVTDFMYTFAANRPCIRKVLIAIDIVYSLQTSYKYTIIGQLESIHKHVYDELRSD